MYNTNFHQVRIDCPICKTIKKINIPIKIIKHSLNLTTISIPKGYVCEHHFQLFIDKNFKVRGYQTVDYEFEKANSLNFRVKTKINNNLQLFDDILLDGNYLKYSPKFITADKLIRENKSPPPRKKGDINLERIYEEFWELIDDDNEEFQEFIKKDKRRKNMLKLFA
ncbi:MAG: hypothetical protein ACTSR8_05805 [Promethearchaeota archaeon]